jgi:ribosomal protein S18 acetylase RimI-like enzyme
MEVIIRELKKQDLPEVKAIFGEFVRYHQQCDIVFEKIASANEMWGDYVYRSHTQDENCRFLVAELDGHIIGYCLGRIAQKPPIYQAKMIGEIGNIAVKEGYKRQGIGGKLFTTIREWFIEHSVDHIEIEAATANPQSVGFWEKMGGRAFIKKMEIQI